MNRQQRRAAQREQARAEKKPMVTEEGIDADTLKSARKLEARANELRNHIQDIDYVTKHKDLLRAFMLIQAINEEEPGQSGVIEEMRHAENTMLAVLFMGKREIPTADDYALLLCTYTLFEIEGITRNRYEEGMEVPMEDMWALSIILQRDYTPVPYGPYKREQLQKAIQEMD